MSCFHQHRLEILSNYRKKIKALKRIVLILWLVRACVAGTGASGPVDSVPDETFRNVMAYLGAICLPVRAILEGGSRGRFRLEDIGYLIED